MAPSIAGTRAAVQAVLDAIPDTTVVPYPRALDQPAKGKYAVLAVESVAPAEVACPAPVVTVVAYLFTHLTLDAPAWDELDAWADEALAAIEAQRAFRWSAVESVIYRDTHPAYRVTLEA